MHSTPPREFSEKVFYLDEFRGRTLGILLAGGAQAAHPELIRVLDELQRNGTRVVLLAAAGSSHEGLDGEVLRAALEGLEGRIWRVLRRQGRVTVLAEAGAFATLLDVAQRLALFKVIHLAEAAAIEDDAGRRRSFVDLEELRQLLGRDALPQRELLGQIEKLVAGGIASVNLCTVTGLHEELFSYAGSGTLFTRERYALVRRLGVDDYDAAVDLIRRGIDEGYLVARTDEAMDELLGDSFGVFVEGRHLAGIGALRADAGATPEAGEVASLYTLTRFVGAGIGRHLVRFAIDRGRRLGLTYVYACTTSQRVGEFFRRLDFTAVDHDRVPASKWRDYDAQRKAVVQCYRYEL